MKKFLGIIESPTPPPTQYVWLYRGEAKYFSNGTWVSLKDKREYKEDSPILIEFTGDEICDYYAIDSNGEAVLASGYGCTSFIPCKGCVDMQITNMQLTTKKNYGLAFYDNKKKLISYIPSLVGKTQASVMQKVQVPYNASYFKASFFDYQTQKNVGNFRCLMLFNNEDIYTKEGIRPYQSGYTYFSKRVNQSITSYWSTTEEIAVTDDYKVTTGVLALPTTYKSTGKKTPLILYAHGLSHYVYYGAWGNTDTFREQKQHWLDMGFAVMDCNGARDNNRKGQFASGICPQGINAYKLCVDYILEHYNIDPDIFIVAGSAGGAVGWNYLSKYGKTVKAAVFIAAWSDLKANAYGGGSQKNLYKEFLGFTDASVYEADKTIGFDPALKIVTINNQKYCFDYYNTPIYGIYGSTDTGAFISSLKNMFTALRNAGAPAQIRMINGVGHEIVSGANIVVDTEIGNWLMSHYSTVNSNQEKIYYPVEYKYVDEEGKDIKDSVISNVLYGTTIDFTSTKPSIEGYEYVDVKPISATITTSTTVVYTYRKLINTYTITYQYKDSNGETIKNSTSEVVTGGTSKDFTSLAPTIEGYEFVSVSPTSSVVNSDITVVFTYNIVENEEDEDIIGNDLSGLFTFDRKSWMCVSNPQFKTSSYFDSGYTDLSAYAGKTIRITVPQYTNSSGGSSTGITFWTATPTEAPSAVNNSLIIKTWDMHNAGNAKGILVEVETVVPANAPYIWTSTYNDNAVSSGVYIGENDGYTDFKCYIVQQDPNDLLKGAIWNANKGFVANKDHRDELGYTIATSSVFKYTAIDVSQFEGKTIQYLQADYQSSAGGISGYGIGFVSTNDKTLKDYKSTIISAVTFPYNSEKGKGTAVDNTVVVPEGAKLMLFTWYNDNSTIYSDWSNVYAKIIE